MGGAAGGKCGYTRGRRTGEAADREDAAGARASAAAAPAEEGEGLSCRWEFGFFLAG